jgi:hypothetical protein
LILVYQNLIVESDVNSLKGKTMSEEKKQIRYPLTERQEYRLKDWHYHGNVPDSHRFVLINDATRALARLIMELTPPTRNQSIALTELESVRMRANAAIAVDEAVYNKEKESR